MNCGSFVDGEDGAGTGAGVGAADAGPGVFELSAVVAGAASIADGVGAVVFSTSIKEDTSWDISSCMNSSSTPSSSSESSYSTMMSACNPC